MICPQRRWIAAPVITLALLTCFGRKAAAQSAPAPGDTFVTIAPGARYAKGAVYRAIAGGHNRDLWATPIRVRVLDLHRYAGGLTPLAAHAGSQTQSLRFSGADGRQYQFRSVDKDPTARLAPELQRSAAAKVLQDGVSSSNPVASLVASALLQAAGVLHVEQTLVVLPDDPALGEFREDFRGVLGMIEERPDENDDERASFAGARRVISPTRLFERLDDGPDDRVDARAFLVARLMDILMGDRDRHRDQWRWASFGDTRPTLWKPISRDHDEAFVKIDGPVLRIVSMYFPPLVTFEAHYPKLYRLNWHAREIDRRFLVELDRTVWDSVATALQRTLSDAVVDDAVRRMPPEMYAVGGEELAALLRVRRDELRQEALDYYAFLSREVEIRATDRAEIAKVTRVDDHHVEVSIRRRGEDEPWFLRRFDDAETREVRLKMFGGDDRVVVAGGTRTPITMRVVGGHGDDVFVDSAGARGVHFYDDAGTNRVESARRVGIDAKPYAEWKGSDLDRYPPREWGTWWRPLPWVSANSDLGAFIGAGLLRTEYGFRRAEYASNIRARIGYATAARAVRAEMDGEFHPENASTSWRLHVYASGIEVLRYYGAGNDTENSGSTDFNKVGQQQYAIEPSFAVPVGARATASVGLAARWAHTGENEGRFIATIRDTLQGGGDYGQVGGRVSFEMDTRDRPGNARSGVHMFAEARGYPAVWDVGSAFGSAEGEVSTVLSANVPATPTLVLRAGGRKLWGPFPFHESAFLGGGSTLRGYNSQRFAGDASVYGGAEIRIAVVRIPLVVPAQWGLFGAADGGRVYVDGESPGGWHGSAGGGIWIAFLDRANTATFGIASSGERTALYAGFGFGF